MMMPSVFESFNARNLTPRQVAQTFIPPKHFGDLCARSHALVIGPRGSGKTTLLKMLQLPALAAWKHADAQRYVRKIDFTGIFIPADISWKVQLDKLGRERLPPRFRDRLSLSAFTSHVLISLIEGFQDCIAPDVREIDAISHYFAELPRRQEAELAALLGRSWELGEGFSSIGALKFALRDRLSKISQFAERYENADESIVEQAVRDQSYLHLQFLECTSTGIEAFNTIAKCPDRKWALLFDELEIAPDAIRRRLLQALRSTDQRLLFKLSISPFTQDFQLLSKEYGASAGQDYLPIELWYSHKEASYHFSEELLASMLRQYGCEPVPPETVFGTSDFDIGRAEQVQFGTAYRPGSFQYQKFRLLAERDASFRRYLSDYRINLRTMHRLPDDERASAIRKITSIVTVRNAFRQEVAAQNGGSVVKQRARKKPHLYAGASSLFAIAEGNPRWFIGMVGPLVKEFAESRDTVKRATQTDAISITANRFRALLSTIPIHSGPGEARRQGLLTLVEEIGSFFFRCIVLEDFTPEPPTTFIVDRDTPRHIVDAIGVALNAGAIVHIPERVGEPVLGSVRDKRFRLSYMVSPSLKLPLTIGKARALSRILAKREGGDRKREDLF
jgi:hypothetical protein